MFWLELILAFAVALIFSALLAGLAGWRYPGTTAAWPGVFFLFLILFFAVWAGAAWTVPAGADLFAGTYWLYFIVIGIFIALLVAAITPPPPRTPVVVETPEEGVESPARREEEEVAGAAIGAFFWVLIVGLVVVIVLRYV